MQTLSLNFTGKGDEYFKIWIVNVFLTILTLGIYSAWATVRTRRYFYSNMQLGDAAFAYTARPIQIFIGRIIVVAVLGLFSGLDAALDSPPKLQIAFFVAFLTLLPWLVIRSYRFTLRYSLLHNLPFNFVGKYAGAARAHLLWGLLAVVSLGLLLPYYVYRNTDYLIKNARYGQTAFSFNASVKRYYLIYAVALLTLVCALALALSSVMSPWETIGVTPTITTAIVILAVITLFTISTYLQVALDNYRWQCTTLAGVSFYLHLKFGEMWVLRFVNLVLTICTFGLFIPFAKIRVARYYAQSFTVTTDQMPEAFFAGEKEKVDSLGDEFGDALDLNFDV